MSEELDKNMTSAPQTAAILVAAGRGERAGQSAEGPKQYRPIGGRAVITYTLKAFAEHERIDTVVVAIHPDDEAFFEAARRGIVGDIRAVHGGATRQESVRLALEALHDAAPDLVLIHDAEVGR